MTKNKIVDEINRLLRHQKGIDKTKKKDNQKKTEKVPNHISSYNPNQKEHIDKDIDEVNKILKDLKQKREPKKPFEIKHQKEPISILTIEELYEKSKYGEKFEFNYKDYLSKLYPFQEKRDIGQIYNLQKDHPAISIPNEAKEIVEYIKSNSKSDEEVAKKICKWVSKYIDYDSKHAEASRRYKEGINKTYLNADETFKLRSGICGESSLLTVGMMNYAGIPSTMYRPHSSHLSVISEGKCDTNKSRKCTWTCDTTFDTFKDHDEEPTTYKTRKDSHYEIGVTDIENNWKYNWSKRRDPSLKPKEAFDVERAELCSDLKYGTIKGMERESEMKNECERRERERKRKDDLEKKKKEKIKKSDISLTYNPHDYEDYRDENYYNYMNEKWKEIMEKSE